MATIFIVVGTRPNFVKVTRFKSVAATSFPDLDIKLIHTGQHYDVQMAQVFFEQFGLQPDYKLELAAAGPARQIAAIIDQLSALVATEKPDMVLAVGDVNSTLAAAIAANKCQIPLAHLEAGLRSFDKSMPEESNRRIADALADLYFVTEDSGLYNLRKEGVEENAIAFVGNTMIDTMVHFEPKIDTSPILNELELTNKKYGLVTIHRPATTDNPHQLKKLLSILKNLSDHSTVVLPLHPRTRQRLQEFHLLQQLIELPRVVITDPKDYFDFQKLIKHSSFVLTDSGGIQEETSFRKISCLTLRPNTERPVTISLGTNELVPFESGIICKKVLDILSGKGKAGTSIPLWDGHATERVLLRLREFFENGC